MEFPQEFSSFVFDNLLIRHSEGVLVLRVKRVDNQLVLRDGNVFG